MCVSNVLLLLAGSFHLTLEIGTTKNRIRFSGTHMNVCLEVITPNLLAQTIEIVDA